MANPFFVPLNAVRAIEIVARAGSLSAAAEELGVTAGAVSQHLRRAEERLGLTLFDRTPQGLRPTEALAQALPQLSAGFRSLQEGMGALRGSDDHVLNLTVASVFASRWLIWRIGAFSRAHPDIEVRLVVTGKLMDLSRPDLDCGIRFGTGQWPGVRTIRIGGERVTPVCAPALAERLKVPEDLGHVPVIIDESSMLSWPDWFAGAGVKPAPALHGPVYSDAALAFDAAISELGVLLAVDMMAEDAVRSGRLVHPFSQSITTNQAYWLAVPEGRREPDKVRIFRQWLLEEAGAIVAR